MELVQERSDCRQSLEHPALIYRSMDEFLTYMVPFVAGGIANRDPQFLAVGTDELAALRSEFAPDAPVYWADTNEWAPEPAPRLFAFNQFVVETMKSKPNRIRLAGEPLWPAGPSAFSREWARYESSLNSVLAPYPVSIVCTYAASRLSPGVVADARRTHPVVAEQGHEGPSSDFEAPASLVAEWNPPLSAPPSSAESMPPPFELSDARAYTSERAAAAGVSNEDVTGVAIAVTEILANADQYAGGAVALRTWDADGYFLCQIDDRGDGIEDALAGYRPPGIEQETGRGLWLARQVVDLLQIVSGPNGTSVRMHVRRR